jgi:TnpA family transposase
MTTLKDTAYPHFKPDISVSELERNYSPTEAELTFIQSLVSGPAPQAAMMIHLKMLQVMGRIVKLPEVPQLVRDHIARCLTFARSPTLKELGRFERGGNHAVKIKKLREFLDVRPLDEKGFAWLRHVAEEAAEVKHSVADIINVMLEELVRHRYELPAFSTLDRAAYASREQSNEQYFNSITSKLEPQTKVMIDGLLKVESGAQTSAWHSLKREPRKPTNKEMRIYLQHIETLKRIVETLPKPEIPIPKMRQFRYLARALDAAEMARCKANKRYALAVVFIRSQYSKSLDDAALLFIKMFGGLENLAHNKLLLHNDGRSEKVDALIELFMHVMQAYKIGGTSDQRIDAIDGTLPAGADPVIDECLEHLAFAGKNYLPFLAEPYKFIRAQLLNCLLIADPQSSSDDRVNERLLNALRLLKNSRVEKVTLEELHLVATRDFNWMSQQWRKLVFAKPDEVGKPDALNRRFFELAVLQMVRDELKSGDLIIRFGEQFDDFREHLVSDETYEQELPRYAEVTEIETDPKVFCETLRDELLSVSRKIDLEWPNNTHAEIVDGRLSLKKPPKVDAHPDAARLQDELGKRLRPVGIIDVLMAVDNWLDLHKMFRPLAGTDSRLEDLRVRVIMVLFCYGCNLGPAQLSRSIRSLSAKQLAWINLKYVTEELLERVTTKVINKFAEFELPSYWGSGEHASADGTRFNLYERNLVSEYHIRYGAYGGIAYTHVSDRFIALISHFISCGTYEGLFILDQLDDNESELKPNKLHGDTHQQSYAAFAMSHLIGIQLMPRIRAIHNLDFFRPSKSVKYDNIDSLFKGSIDWKLIETHLPMMFRIGVSIKLGRITPSTILRRLGTHSRKNKLYFAFQELGKVLRTIFLLKYISDVDLRRFINAETNKSEQFNNFLKLSFFGNGGLIAENVRHEQQKVMKFAHLVANMLIVYNVHDMERVIRELRDEGFAITPELLADLNPYRLGHVNMLGDYAVDRRRRIMDLIVEPILGKRPTGAATATDAA